MSVNAIPGSIAPTTDTKAPIVKDIDSDDIRNILSQLLTEVRLVRLGMELGLNTTLSPRDVSSEDTQS